MVGRYALLALVGDVFNRACRRRTDSGQCREEDCKERGVHFLNMFFNAIFIKTFFFILK